MCKKLLRRDTLSRAYLREVYLIYSKQQDYSAQRQADDFEFDEAVDFVRHWQIVNFGVSLVVTN
jgi:hypothetical protein